MPEGDDWQYPISSVAVISTGGTTFCTGFMVNNVEYDGTPYFMTANHCNIDSGNAASLVTYWNYENSTCRPPGSPESGGPGDGTLDQFNTGSTFRAAGGDSDFTLVEMDNEPDPAWEVGYAGWDARDQATDEAIAIHHPSTDEKRISFENDPTSITDYLSASPDPSQTHIRVEDWDVGTTEPGRPARRCSIPTARSSASCTAVTPPAAITTRTGTAASPIPGRPAARQAAGSRTGSTRRTPARW